MDIMRRMFFRNLLFASNRSQNNKTLVCIFLRGGADTLNLVVPFGDDMYYQLRPSISISSPKKNVANSSIRLDDFYAFHPKMKPLYPLFADGRLGIVQAVGSDHTSGSHFEAQDQMEHGRSANQSLGSGWLGRYLRTHSNEHKNAISAVAMGTTVPESLRGAPSINVLQSLDDLKIQTATGESQAAINAIAKMYGTDIGVLGQHGQDTLQLLHKIENLKKANSSSQNGVVYPKGNFAKQLQEIARLIKAQLGLRVACIDLGGWDTHFFQGQENGLQAGNISTLADGLAAFDTDIKKYQSSVTTIVMTEFGRRVYENSSLGTDHGRAFSFFALGNTVKGGKVVGPWPGLQPQDDENAPGGLKVMYDYRSVLTEVLISALGCDNPHEVFAGFSPKKVDLMQ